MSKKIIVLMGIVMCVVVSAGIFYWNSQNQEPEVKGSPDDYVVVESELEQAEQGRYVENKKAGLKVRIPDGWTEEKMDVMEGSMVFYSPDVEGIREGSIRPPLKKGCVIEVAIIYEKMSFDEIKEEVKQLHDDPDTKLDEFEMINIKNLSALKNKFENEILGHAVAVYIPNESLVYSFCIYTAPEDIEKCSQEFNMFLENIVIE